MPPPIIVEPSPILAAIEAINAKVATLAGALGNTIGEITEIVPPPNGVRGWVQLLDTGAVYFSAQTGAHEVHGDIYRKYKFLGPNWTGPVGDLLALGYPITDERPARGPVGRVSDFQHGSIYWHPRTGPMLVHEILNEAYQASGGETGPLGYPTADTHRWKTANPLEVHLAWGIFEKGAIASNLAGQAQLCGPLDMATVSKDDLKTLVRKQADKSVHAQDINVGLQPEIDISNVSDWQFGFPASGGRIITYTLHAFKDTGLVLPDVNFTVEIGVQFGFTSEPSFVDPSAQTLIATTNGADVEGVTFWFIPIAHGSQEVVGPSTYALGSVPMELPNQDPPVRVILDVIVSEGGDLTFLTNPIGAGNFGPIVQQKLDAMVSALLG
jgi:hypothetical protein